MGLLDTQTDTDVGTNTKTSNRRSLAVVFQMKGKEDMKELEDKARNGFAESSIIQKIWLYYLSIIKTFWFYLISTETLFVTALTVALTCYYYNFLEDNERNGGLDWVLLGFALITPLSITIRLVFIRREKAISSLSDFKNASFHYYLAHATWYRNVDDRNELLAKSDDVIELLLEIADELTRYLTLPTISKPIHKVTEAGRSFSKEVRYVRDDLYYSLYSEKCSKLATMTTAIIKDGLSTSEASRVRQFERLISGAIEDLRVIKNYR